jgi:hypothetical protein
MPTPGQLARNQTAKQMITPVQLKKKTKVINVTTLNPAMKTAECSLRKALLLGIVPP